MYFEWTMVFLAVLIPISAVLFYRMGVRDERKSAQSLRRRGKYYSSNGEYYDKLLERIDSYDGRIKESEDI